MKTGILTFEQHLGKKEIGSSRIRGHWIVKNWKKVGIELGECELFKFGGKYDAVIFQKAYFIDYARAFKGVKILDLCDPDWLHWSYRVKEMIDECDAVTCSSEELAKAVRKFTDKPVIFIPDGVDMEVLPKPKTHSGPTKVAVWYGYQQNFPILDSCISALVQRNLSLIVVSDNVYTPPGAFKIELRNLPFSQNHTKDIQLGDVCLNPKFNKGKWKFKSDNKTSLALALGVPVAHTIEELDAMMTEEQRKKASVEGYEFVRQNRNVLYSVELYKGVINDILSKKQQI